MPDRTLYQWFTGSSDRYPERPALTVGGRTYTYRELRHLSEALAARVAHEHGRPERFALLASRSLVAFTGYLAAQRLGAAVIPLNPRFPPSRNHTICELTSVDVVLADEQGARKADLVRPTGPVLCLSDEDVLELAAEPGATAGLAPYRADAGDVAYILFTSGSTGRPKGVPIRHRNVEPYVAHNIERFQVGPGCRVSHTFDLSFDPSVFDLFVTWGSGATLVAPRRNELLAPVDYLVENEITHWYSVPSVVSVSANLGNLFTGVSTTLRHSKFVGEPLTFELAAAWRSVTPSAAITNVYGPTELGVTCTEYTLPPDEADWPSTANDTVPIGPVHDHLDWLVLDEAGRPASTGELVVRGSQRFDGYLEPADDIGRFLLHDGTTMTPYDGSTPLTAAHYYRTGDRVRREGEHWVHLGRLDNQVKISGYRVELGDIESTLRRHEDVKQAVVIAPRTGTDVELVGIYTGDEVDPTALTHWLRTRLPTHMVPRRFQHLAEFPLNINGKVDRKRLTESWVREGVS